MFGGSEIKAFCILSPDGIENTPMAEPWPSISTYIGSHAKWESEGSMRATHQHALTDDPRPSANSVLLTPALRLRGVKQAYVALIVMPFKKRSDAHVSWFLSLFCLIGVSFKADKV